MPVSAIASAQPVITVSSASSSSTVMPRSSTPSNAKPGGMPTRPPGELGELAGQIGGRDAVHGRAVLGDTLREQFGVGLQRAGVAKRVVARHGGNGRCGSERRADGGEDLVTRAHGAHQSLNVSRGGSGSSRIAVHPGSAAFASGPRPRRASRCAPS